MDEGLQYSTYSTLYESYLARRSLPYSVGNYEECFRILNVLITAANTQPDKEIVVNGEAVHDFVLREADLLQEELVYKGEQTEVLCRLVQMINEEIPEYIERVNSCKNIRLRAVYKRNGLHGMYKINVAPDVCSADTVCLICCDGVPSFNTTTRCIHDPILCAECRDKFDRCPVCMECVARA